MGFRLVSRRLYVSVAEYAQATGASADTIRWRLRHGKLRGRKFKSGWAVLASQLPNANKET
jgi:hypothetical protein